MGPGAARVIVKDSNKGVDELRKKSKSAIDRVVKILSCSMIHRLTYVLHHIPDKFRLHVGRWISQCNTTRGAAEVYMNCGRGFYQEAVSSCIDVVVDPIALDHMGLRAGYADAATPVASNVANSAWCFLVHFLGFQLQGFMHYSHNIPVMFVMLLHHDKAVVDGCLARLKSLWSWLKWAEQVSQHIFCGKGCCRAEVGTVDFRS